MLATKVYGGRDPWPNTSRLSALHIRQACDDSLRRLQTDHIDLYQMHHVDRDTPWDEIWQAMDLLVAQGKVLYVGSSNFAGWHLVQANEAARRRGSLGLVSEQSLYNLAPARSSSRCCPRPRPTASASCRGARSAAACSAARCEGGRGPAGRRARAAARSSAIATSSRPGRTCARELGEEPADVALAWLLHQQAVTAPIIGPRTIEQFHGLAARHRDRARPGRARPPRQDLPGPGRRGSRGLRLVGRAVRVRRCAP